MKLKEGFIVREIMDEFLVVPVGERIADFNGLISLNSSGVVLWNALEEDVSKDDLVKILLDKYDIDKSTAENDTELFLDKLKNNNLIVE